jgi:hypothetical protein
LTLASGTPTITYLGTGAVSTYSFSYPVFIPSHLTVTVIGPTSNYLLVLNTDYTVAGLSAMGSPAQPGSISLINSGQAWLTGNDLTTAYTITIQRVLPIAQNTSIRNQGDFYPATLEDAYDYITMILQQLNGFQQNPIYTDIVTGFTYQIVFVNGVLSQQRLT